MVEQINFWANVFLYLSAFGAFAVVPAYLIHRKFREHDTNITDATDEELEEIFKDINS